jgi:alpha-beta hydrolase superfamily lysophospholipase
MKPLFKNIILPALFAIACAGCMKLDNFLYDNEALTTYEPLPNSFIPDSAREFVTLESQGKKIYGYFLKANRADTFSRPEITVVYCHGNYQHLKYYWDRAEYLYRMGFNVFIFDYKGFGMSEGESTEESLYADGRAALQYVLNRPNVVDSNVVLYGFSLGNVVSFDLAAKEFTPKVFIAEAPFASGDALVKSGTVIDIPGSYVLKGEYNNAEKAKDIHAPFLLLYATKDAKFPITQGEEIFKNANEPKWFLKIEGAEHSTIPDKMGVDNYLQTVRNFILNERL